MVEIWFMIYQRRFDRKLTGNDLADIKLNYCTLILYLPAHAVLLNMGGILIVSSRGG